MREYAIGEATGKRHLIWIVCDGCSDRIKPHPEISESGWIKVGWIKADYIGEIDLCAECASQVGSI